MGKIILDEKLPEDLQIKSAGSHFYLYGISLHKQGEFQRSKFNHPLVVCITLMITMSKSVISLSLDGQKTSDLTFLLIGDWVHFLGVRIHGNVLLILTACFVLITQLFNIWDCSDYSNNQNKQDTSYLALINMLTGKISPLEIGLIKTKSVEKLLTTTKYLLAISEIMSRSFSISGTIFTSVLLFFMPSYKFIPLVLPYMVHLTMGGYYLGTFITYQMSYFYIITTYFQLRIRHLNEKIDANMKKSRINGWTMRAILYENNSVHKSIETYNRLHSSKLLFNMIFVNGLFIDFAFYIYFFVDLNFLMKNMCFYFAIIWLTIFIIILNFSSQIVNEIKKTNELFTKIIYENKFEIGKKLKVT